MCLLCQLLFDLNDIFLNGLTYTKETVWNTLVILTHCVHQHFSYARLKMGQDLQY